MAVSIDTVYQRVLALANKEQRGYITPQEFNLFANQAQMAIYETYFYEKEKALMESSVKGTDTESDIVYMINEKLKPFYEDSVGAGSGINLAADLYRLENVYLAVGNSGTQLCQEITEKEYSLMMNTGSDLTPNLLNPTTDRPVYRRVTNAVINCYSSSNTTAATSGVTYSYYKSPTDCAWGYTVVNYEALYDATQTTDFQLHPSEESSLVIKILELAGITLNKPGLIQVANQEEAEMLQMKNS